MLPRHRAIHSRRGLSPILWKLLSIAVVSIALAGSIHAAEKPNIVVIFTDDLGYGDIGPFGHPTIRTPHLDRMAAEGMKLTQFYSAAPVCTPSRAALLTGRLPIRSGMCSDRSRVLFPNSTRGLPDSEITIAQALKKQGYATGMVGKWHLGHLPQYLPTRRGFDEYFGIPYSNDMKPCPLIDGEKAIEEPVDQTTVTRRYTQRAVDFIKRKKDQPFFLYFAHTFPHVPLFASPDFKGKSLRGIYGDTVEELDWSVGQILDTLRALDLDKKTLVIFTSDNGPWLIKRMQGGTAGLLRGGKGGTFEGGMREPTLAWWPGKIKAGATSPEMASTMDIFNTSLKLAGAPIPNDRVIDGVDMSPILFGEGPSLRKIMIYYRGTRVFAIRKGAFKAHIITKPEYGPGEEVHHDPPLLYNLHRDPSEQFNVVRQEPQIVKDLLAEIEAHKKTVEPVESQLDFRK